MVHNIMRKLYCERSTSYILSITEESTDKCGCNMCREQKIIEFLCVFLFQSRSNRGVGRPQMTGNQNRSLTHNEEGVEKSLSLGKLTVNQLVKKLSIL